MTITKDSTMFQPGKTLARLGLTIGSMLLSIAAHAQLPTKAVKAQCTLEAYSDTGKNFLNENQVTLDKDRAYMNWMLICMQSKGFEYSVKKCPLAKSGTYDVYQALEAECYEKIK